MLAASVALCPTRAISTALRLTRPPLLAQSSRPACVTYAMEARFVGLAYNHIVHLASGCSVAKSCTVATDVNPEPQVVTVPPGSTIQVVTFIGSPARTFTVSVQCAP